MIDEDRTLSLFGYTSNELKTGSHKTVVAVCDVCDKTRIIENRQYRALCFTCSHKTDEIRDKISLAGRGKSHTLETRRKMGASRTGERNPNWKGGVTPIIHAIRCTPAYKNWRTAVFERDDYTCQMCNERGCYLEAHHIRPVRDHKNDLLIFDVGNGITLCKDCHSETKGVEDVLIHKFEVILSLR